MESCQPRPGDAVQKSFGHASAAGIALHQQHVAAPLPARPRPFQPQRLGNHPPQLLRVARREPAHGDRWPACRVREAIPIIRRLPLHSRRRADQRRHRDLCRNGGSRVCAHPDQQQILRAGIAAENLLQALAQRRAIAVANLLVRQHLGCLQHGHLEAVSAALLHQRSQRAGKGGRRHYHPLSRRWLSLCVRLSLFAELLPV